jgi:hypothetical protein
LTLIEEHELKLKKFKKKENESDMSDVEVDEEEDTFEPKFPGLDEQVLIINRFYLKFN